MRVIPLHVAGLAIAALAIVVGLGVAVATGRGEPFDAAVISLVRHEAAREPLAFLRPLTEAGSTWAVTAVAVAMVALMSVLGRPWIGLAAGLTILGVSIANTAAKTFVARARPELLEPLVVEHGFSFPSGHAAIGTATWGIVAVVVARSGLPRLARVGLVVALVVLALLIGVSRIYLGVHYPTDVLAGWLVGGTVVLLFAYLAPDRGALRVSPGASTEPGDEAALGDREAPRSGPPARG